MGAQTDDRLTQYKKRYKDWEDPNGKISELNYQTAFDRNWSQGDNIYLCYWIWKEDYKKLEQASQRARTALLFLAKMPIKILICFAY